MSDDWKARAAEIRAADDDEWDGLSVSYDADWKAAYCREFRRYAAERGWLEENIESGWLDQLSDEAFISCALGDCPVETARQDVLECERECIDE